MNKREFTASLVWAAGIMSVQGKSKNGKKRSTAVQGTKAADLDSALSNLTLFGHQPESVLDMYRAAWKVLSETPNASFADLAQDPDFQKVCADNGIEFLGGPLLGCVTDQSVTVWVRTLNPAKVQVRLNVGGKSKTFGPVESTLESGLTAIVPVDGLTAGARYPYEVLVDGKPIKISEQAAIVAAPAPSDTGKVRITFGSCFHRWGLANQRQAGMILSRHPSAMLLLGDVAVQDRNNHLGLHRADYLMRDLHPAWQDLAATLPMYATWDDHDYFDNDKSGVPRGYTTKDKQGVCDVFKEAWNNPSYGFDDEHRGVFMRTRLGPCDVIMVDNRYFREGGNHSFLGDEQMAWLEEQLLDCKGPFIILSCGSMWSDYVSSGKDSWGKCDPAGREKIFRLIEKHNIGGVLLISGDRHGARGFTIPRPNGFKFYEFEAGSLGGRMGPPATQPNWKTQFYGISDRYAFGEFTIDADRADPEVTFRLIEDKGAVICEKKLKRSELMPRKA